MEETREGKRMEVERVEVEKGKLGQLRERENRDWVKEGKEMIQIRGKGRKGS